MAVVWTGSYFRPDKQWTQAETWSRQHADVLGRDRLLLPIWRQECPIPALLSDLLRIDFRDDERFEEAVAELIRAIGLPHLAPRRLPEPLPIPPRPSDKSVLVVDTLGALFVPLLIFLGLGLLCMVGLGGLLIQKGHVLPGCTVAIGSLLSAFGYWQATIIFFGWLSIAFFLAIWRRLRVASRPIARA